MTTKEALPRGLPSPQTLPKIGLDERTLHFAAVALLERLVAYDNDIEDAAVQALVFNMQNLMRLFDHTIFQCDINQGTVTFRRTVLKGDWETGRWNLEWNADRDGS